MEISRNHPVPLYIQIAENLKQKIHSGEMEPGERIGSQDELASTYGVSKITIRQAIQLLDEEGIITIKQGKGTYVKSVKVEQELLQLKALTEVIEESGYEPHVKVISYGAVATSELKELGDQSFYIERLHSVKQKPLAFAEIFLPNHLGEKLSQYELENHTIYDLLQKKHDIQLGEAVQKIESCPATITLADHLAIPEGTPLLKAERTTYDTNNNIVEIIHFYYRHDEFSFNIRLTAANQVKMWPIIAK